jgi:peptidylprolyl isomerase
MAVILLGAADPACFANGTIKDSGKQVATRRKKSVRRRCRRVVVAPSKGIATTTPTGLTYIITRHSKERQPQAGETVLVNYTGLLSSGVKFDSSLDRGQPFDFPLGKGRVIKGWDEGIAKLRVGEQATLIIPPQLGYGDRGAGGGVIPPNATLIFLVELVGIKETPKTTP